MGFSSPDGKHWVGVKFTLDQQKDWGIALKELYAVQTAVNHAPFNSTAQIFTDNMNVIHWLRTGFCDILEA